MPTGSTSPGPGRASLSRFTHPAYRHRALQFLADAVLAAIAFALAFVLRFIDAGEIPERYVDMLLASVAFVAIGKALIFTAPRPPREVVALLPHPRLPGAPARDRPGERGAGRRLHGRLAVRLQPAALGRRLRLHPHDGPPGRRPDRHAPVDRAAVEGAARAEDTRLADRRRRLGRPDGRARASAEPGAGRRGDRLRRRRPAKARHGPARACASWAPPTRSRRCSSARSPTRS